MPDNSDSSILSKCMRVLSISLMLMNLVPQNTWQLWWVVLF